MKKLILLTIVFILFNSCSTLNEQRLSMIDKPIRLASFSILVSGRNSLVNIYSSGSSATYEYDFNRIYNLWVDILIKSLPYYSNLLEKETGFPIDIDKFIEEFKETHNKVRVTDNGYNNYLLTWDSPDTKLPDSHPKRPGNMEPAIWLNLFTNSMLIIKTGGSMGGPREGKMGSGAERIWHKIKL